MYEFICQLKCYNERIIPLLLILSISISITTNSSIQFLFALEIDRFLPILPLSRCSSHFLVCGFRHGKQKLVPWRERVNCRLRTWIYFRYISKGPIEAEHGIEKHSFWMIIIDICLAFCCLCVLLIGLARFQPIPVCGIFAWHGTIENRFNIKIV